MFIEQVNGQKIKIKFDINEKQLLLGDILKITSSGKNGILVQVIGISTAEKNPNFNVAESKILFTIDSTGKLTNWQGNIPSQDFIINKLSAKEILLCSKALNPQNPVPLGILSLYPDTEISLEATFFEKPTVIYCDKQTQKDNILNILSCELSKAVGKTVLIDFSSNFSDLKVSSILEAGKNIKLPFDLKGLELLYNKSLSGLSPEARAAVEDIFMEIENYLSSGEVEFIPFNSFRKAVESVYETNKITELVLLKNKLVKLQKQGVFADKKQEIQSLNENIRNNNLIIIDLSKYPSDWHKDLIESIIDSNTNKYKQEFFLLIDLTKISADKTFIENLCGKANKNGIYPVIITGHESETAVSLLSYASNIISFAPENTTKITALQDNLIRLKDNEAVITGKITNDVPLYVNIYDAEACEGSCHSNNSDLSQEIYLFDEATLEEEKYETYKSFSNEEHEENSETDEENFNYSNQFAYDETNIELIENISNLQEEVYISPKKVFEEEENEESDEEYYDENDSEESADEDEDDFDIELEEEDEVYNTNSKNSSLNSAFYDDDEEILEEDDEDESESDEEEDDFDIKLEEEDEVYSTTSTNSSFYDEVENEKNYISSHKYASGFSEEDLSSFMDDDEEKTAPSYLAKEEEQGDEDFDYYSNEEFQDESVLDYSSFYDADEEENTVSKTNNYQEDFSDEYDDEEADTYEKPVIPSARTKPISVPMPDIPIYSTPTNPDKITAAGDFQEGDKVKHAKYGLGTVTKIIGSNEKKLCSIQFEDVGKRLLDPKLAELVKI